MSEPPVIKRPVMHQRWRQLLFLHWAVPAEVVQATLPAGLEVQTYDGRAWLGVVPFLMEGIRPVGLPAVRGLSAFGELNLRTYVQHRSGVTGVWFYSLDAHQHLAVQLARTLFHLPYHYAAIDSRPITGDADARRIGYWWRRGGRSRGLWAPAFVYDPPQATTPTQPDSLDSFLVDRYTLFAHDARRDRLSTGQVTHEPYRIGTPTLHRWDPRLFDLNGLDRPGRPPDHACWSPGVDVRVERLHRLR
jgi:uncharacterized protein YqjF (DUF2071 family)